MTQYNTNADFGTDAVITEADLDDSPDTSENITGYKTQPVDASFGYYKNFIIRADGDLGENSRCVEANGFRNQFLATLDHSVATSEAFEVLLRFRCVSSVSGSQMIMFAHDSSDNGYGLEMDSGNSDAQLWYMQAGQAWISVGSAVAFASLNITSFAADTWYFLRVKRSTTNQWSWKVWDGVFGDEPASWDEEDTTTGANDTVTAFNVGVGLGSGAATKDFDWFSSADGGDSAPGPAGAGPDVTGTGTPASQSSAASGTGEVSRTGSGAAAAQSTAVAGAGDVARSGSGVLAAQASAAAGVGTKVGTVTIELSIANGTELKDALGGAVASLANIAWEWYDTPGSTAGEPIDFGVFTTNVNGEATVVATGSELSSGGFGQLILYHPTDPNIRQTLRVAVE